MPSAPPSSAPVSEIPEAAPARSGGAEQTIRSVVAVNTGASPSEMTSEAPARTARSASGDPPTWVSTAEADRRQGQPGADHRRRADPAQDPGRQVRPDDEPDRRRQRPQPRLQRRQPEHQLEILGDEQEVADRDEDASQVGGQRGVERRVPEQPEVDHRVGQVQLAARRRPRRPPARPGRRRRRARRSRPGRSASARTPPPAPPPGTWPR